MWHVLKAHYTLAFAIFSGSPSNSLDLRSLPSIDVSRKPGTLGSWG
jgi:hypothetical protein